MHSIKFKDLRFKEAHNLGFVTNVINKENEVVILKAQDGWQKEAWDVVRCTPHAKLHNWIGDSEYSNLNNIIANA